MSYTRPNFLYIGPDKAGSTWLYQVLRRHPQVFLAPSKEIFFFDRYYSKGWRWYSGFFKRALHPQRVIGEISHDYLFSDLACQRISHDLPDVRLMVCLREPVDRAYSAYLYMLRQGRLRCSFRQAVETVDELIDHGLYAKHLTRYFAEFPKDRIHVAIFDELKVDPSQMLGKLCTFLEISPLSPDEITRKNVLQASSPRSYLAAKIAKEAAMAIRAFGLPTMVARIKEMPIVSRLLYASYNGNKPQLDCDFERELKARFVADVYQVDAILGSQLVSRWGYDVPSSGSVYATKSTPNARCL